MEHHYDIGGVRGEKLYDIFLDKTHRLYSCAYWKNDTKTLEEAQQNKIDHIVKKLDIKEGQKVLEVGCGWGGMAFEIAKQKKCEVTGISLSKNQIDGDGGGSGKQDTPPSLNITLPSTSPTSALASTVYRSPALTSSEGCLIQCTISLSSLDRNG